MKSRSILQQSREEKSLVTCYSRYHSDAAVSQYCDAHYGPQRLGVANFPARLAQLCAVAMEGNPCRRALDLGCAVGRASFELTTHFDQVTGIDYSARFIELADRLRNYGTISYQLVEEGELISDHQVHLADLGLAGSAYRVAFHQGNAMQLDEQYSGNDLVLAANLIDRLPDPGKFLAGIHRFVVPGGLLAIASPYNWLESFTPQHKWLGGRFRAGIPLSSLEGLRRKLAAHFAAVGEPLEVAFVIRENARKFQCGLSQLTLWRRIR